MIHILKSYSSQRLVKILNGEADTDVWKTIPQCLKNGEPITVWGYCTIGKPFIASPYWRLHNIGYKDIPTEKQVCNGLIVCKFVVEKANKLKWGRWVGQEEWNYRGWNYEHDELLNHTCLSNEQLNNYGDGKPIYALHITALEIIEPLALGAFQSEQITGRYETGVKVRKWLPITKAPQSWMYVLPPKEGEGK